MPRNTHLRGSRLTVAHTPCNLTCRRASSASDPLLSSISSYLNTDSRASSQQQLAALNSGASGASGRSRASSGRLELGTAARLWEAQWPELTIQHLLGRGSFGSVYLAEWNQIPVAVKVLISRGE